MKKITFFCITNKQINNLEKLNFNLVGVGQDSFSEKYINCKIGENIQFKEKYYSELTFHYWFWKNELSKYDEDSWLGFCQKRRFWLKEKKESIKNLDELIKNILVDVPDKWNNYNSVLCDPIDVSGAKKMKMIKRGWKNLLKDPTILFDSRKHSISLHFDMHHGYKNLEKAINLLDNKNKQDFFDFVNKKTDFNPHIMCIATPAILEKWFESLFSWLERCEAEFGFDDLKGYDTQRLYAYLAERYLSYWFKKYTKFKELPWAVIQI